MTRILLPLLVATTAIASPAAAQLINWGPVLPTLNSGDVSLNGTLVVARNLHAATAVVSPIVNGVQFLGGLSPTGWGGAITNDGLNGSTTGDTEYDNLLRQARATNGVASSPTGWGAIQLDTLGTLTVGHTYEIQCWYTDQRTGSATNALYDRMMTLSSVVGAATIVSGEITNLATLTQGPDSGLLDADPDDAPAINPVDVVFGSYCTGTFTRTSNDPMYLLVQGSHPLGHNLKPHLTALQIRDVSTAAFSVSGSACPSSVGVATLSAPGLPVLGSTLQVEMSNVSPFGLPLMVAGLTTVAPFPIAVIGLTTDPTCLLTVDMIALLGPLPTVGNVATMSLGIPNNAGLVGASMFVQGAQLEATGWSLTEMGQAVFGY